MPGVYAIVNTEQQKYYIGEAGNLAAGNLAGRLSDHYDSLQNNRHDCKKLQEDWNLLGSDKFEFIILEMGFDAFSDRVKRLQAERQYIQKYISNIYNMTGLLEIRSDVVPSTQQRNSIKVTAFGVSYESVS
jgi:hypothetical protein